MSEGLYMTAVEAAEALGISVSTLYAYVSRGLVRSEEGTGKTRARRYRREDVDALLARKDLRQNPAKAVESALHFGTPLLESAITLIADGRFYYRGHDVLALAESRPFEEVAALIWTGDFDTAGLFPAQPPPVILPDAVQALPLMARFQALLPLAAVQDLAAYNLAETAVAQTGARILTLLTAVACKQPPAASIAQSLQQAWAPTHPAAVDLFDLVLILCADHELNVSSFTARCVASALGTPYGAVQAGLAALQGAKHGGFTERVAALLREAEMQGVRETIASYLRRGEGVPGFGHPLYAAGDPRARLLLERVTAVAPDAPVVQLAQAFVDEMAASVGLPATVDFALVVLARALALPPGAALTLFALGRTAGWLGHAIEQYRLGQIIRPRARYVGERPVVK
ncbi:MAG: helix-turn-helix domain-containing protein [Ardenticatenaceae bacterium]|nr:citrate synthase family protein [Anaerolineales bacterium]MCB8920131.1 helix-turn-helix domain-containing protein [Ardenticatenaceae bacterium]MCB8992193.1 helix-turn-helix domain-containing protein [Ardenticatenaceae bacterium]MCB9005076.1 helix-turn-helix domain-containing protein [Ardenticatenaceae bacterium]